MIKIKTFIYEGLYVPRASKIDEEINNFTKNHAVISVTPVAFVAAAIFWPELWELDLSVVSLPSSAFRVVSPAFEFFAADAAGFGFFHDSFLHLL